MKPLDLFRQQIHTLYQSPMFLPLFTMKTRWFFPGLKISAAIVALAMTSASSLQAQPATQHQFIGAASNWVSPANRWSSTSPYVVPGASGPQLGSRLDMAGTGSLIITDGSSRAVTELTVSSGKGAVNQEISAQGEGLTGSLTVGSAVANDGLISMTVGNLRLYNLSPTQRLNVSVNGSVQVAVSSTLSLGIGNATVRAVNSFTVSEGTTINGVVANHFASGSTSLGNVTLGASGFLFLANTGQGSPTVTVRGLSGNGSVFAADAVGTAAAQRLPTLSIVTGTNTNASFSGTLGNSLPSPSAGNSILSVAVSGSGRQTFAGVGSYTGSTNITGGTLVLSGNGSINGTSGIRLSDGALLQKSSTALSAPITWTGGMLGGTTSITGNVATSGGGAKTLNPGDGVEIGALTVSGGLTLDAFTSVDLTLSGTQVGITYDTISSGGQLALNSATLNLTLGYTPLVGDIFTIATFGSLSGTFAGLADGSSFVVGSNTFLIDYGANSIQLEVTAVPEPNAAFMAMAAVGGMLVLFRIRRR